MNILEDPARKFFSTKVTDRDRAIFEAGIALGMVIHQFTGIPIKFEDQIKLLEKIIELSIKSQPYKKEAHVTIKIDNELKSENPYSYTTLKSRNIDVSLVVEYGKSIVKARLRYIPELNYTLAYLEDIEENK